MNKIAFLLATGLTTLSNGLHAEPATVVRNSELRSKPYLDAPTLAKLAEGTKVERIANLGGWSKIKLSNGKTGYVRLLNLRIAQATDKNKIASANKLGNVIRTGSTGTLATTGVKGITKEDLAKATPRPDEVAKMENYAISTEAARETAKTVKLSAQTSAFLETQP